MEQKNPLLTREIFGSPFPFDATNGASYDLYFIRAECLEEEMKNCTITLALAACLALSGCQTASMTGGRTGEFGCIAGTVGGAVVGGLAGATIGSGTGQLWAVGGGAVLGSAAGSALTCT